MEAETGRLRATGLQAERALESREKAHHQRVKELEGQVTSDTPTPYRRCPGAAGHNARNSWMRQRHSVIMIEDGYGWALTSGGGDWLVNWLVGVDGWLTGWLTVCACVSVVCMTVFYVFFCMCLYQRVCVHACVSVHMRVCVCVCVCACVCV